MQCMRLFMQHVQDCRQAKAAVQFLGGNFTEMLKEVSWCCIREMSLRPGAGAANPYIRVGITVAFQIAMRFHTSN